jgi:predicted transcriptional regulator
MPKLASGAQRMLRVLANPNQKEPMTMEELGALTGVQSDGGSFSTYLSSLHTAGLIRIEGKRGAKTVQANKEALFL